MNETQRNDAVLSLRRGSVVAFPTETVWGLGARAADASAVERLYQLKGRPRNNPMALLVLNADMARRCTIAWSDDAAALARAFWPGPLTLVLPAAPHIDPIITAHTGTVGIRCPDHPVAHQLIEGLAEPLVATSANLSSQPELGSADDIRRAFAHVRGDTLFVLDVHSTSSGMPSTVYDITSGRILRAGAVTQAMIERVLST